MNRLPTAARRLRLVIVILWTWLPFEASAQQVLRTIPFYQHNAFGREAGIPSTVWAIDQTPDGYLWVGTLDGLFRFDGITFERVKLPATLPPRSDMVSALSADRDGNLWIAHDWGGVTLMRRDGHFLDMKIDTAGPVMMAADPAGRMWIATYAGGGIRLYRYDHIGPEKRIVTRFEMPDGHLGGIMASSDGAFWFSQTERLLRLPPGGKRFEVVNGTVDIGGSIVEAPNHRIWLLDATGMHPVSRTNGGGNSWQIGPPIYKRSQRSTPNPIVLADTNGRLWTVESGLGIVRIDPTGTTQSAINIFDMRAVTSPTIWAGFRDREGNIWFGTNGGLDRFRPASFAGSKVAVDKAGVNHPQIGFASYVVPTADGSVLISSFNSLFQTSGRGLPKLIRSDINEFGKFCADNRGNAWLVTSTGLEGIGTLNRGHKIPAPLTMTRWRSVQCQIAGDQLWVSNDGLLKFERGRWTNEIADPTRPKAATLAMTADAKGRFFTYQGRRSLFRYIGGRFEKIWDRDAISLQLINVLAPSGDGILIGGTTGLARYDGKRIAVLPRTTYPELDEISGIAIDPKGVTWLLARQGLIRISTADLDRAFERPGLKIAMRIFGTDDGLDDGNVALGLNNLARDSSGQLWLATANGFYWFDPQNLRGNTMPPPVAIKSVNAGRVNYRANTGLELPKGTSDLEIDYTALSLANPERVKFRYRLVGQDKAWVDPGTRRQAIYTNLGPGSYRFEVIAANENGVWNKTGASFEFSIPPTFLQSRLFLILCLVGTVVTAAALLRFWTRMVSARVRSRIAQRTRERERLAREIHDTLLQSVQGLIMRFHNITLDIAESQPARQQMLEALDSADAVVIEGRDRVQELRRWADSRSLSEVVAKTADRLLLPENVKTQVKIEGLPRDVQPAIADELLRITDEALFNVAQHAHARSVAITIIYSTRSLILRVADDGIGIPPDILANGEREGHFGLIGMRERADKIGAQMSLSSGPDGGTQVEVTVDAAIAYTDGQSGFSLPWWRRLALDDPDE